MGEGERENSHLRRDIFSLFTEERDLENCWGTRKRIFLVLNMTENKKKNRLSSHKFDLGFVFFLFCFSSSFSFNIFVFSLETSKSYILDT
jgi:hypothetical protein